MLLWWVLMLFFIAERDVPQAASGPRGRYRAHGRARWERSSYPNIMRGGLAPAPPQPLLPQDSLPYSREPISFSTASRISQDATRSFMAL